MSEDRFKHGWATGSMECRKCGRRFEGVRILYSCHDKVGGEWPRCCGDLAKFCNDWIEEPKPNVNGISRQVPSQLVEKQQAQS